MYYEDAETQITEKMRLETAQYYFVLLKANYRKICCLQPSSHPFSAVQVLLLLYLNTKRKIHCLQSSSHPFSAVRFGVSYSIRLAYKR